MEKELQHKLFNYQAQPPVGVWDKINVALEEEASKPFLERLTNYEPDPPPFIWDNIAASLDESVQKTIPLRQRLSKPLRYSTAAACLIAVAVLITLLVNKNSASTDVSLTAIPPSAIPSEESNTQDQNIANEEASNNPYGVAHEENKGNKISPIRVKSAHPSFKRGNYVVADNRPKLETDIPQRYIIYASSSGDAFRISKKLFDLFACSDVDVKCRENIELMQQQVASPSVMAAADFSGLLDLLQSINNQ